jgi:hypothetical protein
VGLAPDPGRLPGGARAGWQLFSILAFKYAGLHVPVKEAAASHWFTWALGALAIEAAGGVVALHPRWRDLRLGLACLAGAAALNFAWGRGALTHYSGEIGRSLMDPLWGLGFFVLVNRTVAAERQWAIADGGWRMADSGSQVRSPDQSAIRRSATRSAGTHAIRRGPAWVRRLSRLGVFSYSLYLTHLLVVGYLARQAAAWFGWSADGLIAARLFLFTPLAIGFAWLFFQLFERPYLNREK